MTQSVYTPTYYEDRMRPTVQAADRIVPLVIDLARPRSVVDVGCGSGIWLAKFLEHGVTDILGIDGPWTETDTLKIPASQFEPQDLTRPLQADRTFDLAMSIEVAEHLPDHVSGQFIAGLCRLAPVVFFSAAIPGQGGTDHINEQWPSYWRERFQREGYVAIDALRPRIWNDLDDAAIYPQNVGVYVRETALGDYPELQQILDHTGGAFPDIVHPRIFQGAVRKAQDVRAVNIEALKRSLGPLRPVAQRAKRSLVR